MRPGFAPLLCLLLPAAALAGGPGESALGAGPGLAVLSEGTTRAGASGEVRFPRGLSDSWSARMGLQAAWMPAAAGASAKQLVAPALGLTAAADVLNLVPFAEAGVVLGDIRGGGLPSRQRLGGQFGIGADYLASRHVTLSLLARVDYFALRLSGASESRPVQLTLALHLGRVF
jgi:hypothetical protein